MILKYIPKEWDTFWEISGFFVELNVSDDLVELLSLEGNDISSL